MNSHEPAWERVAWQEVDSIRESLPSLLLISPDAQGRHGQEQLVNDPRLQRLPHELWTAFHQDPGVSALPQRPDDLADIDRAGRTERDDLRNACRATLGLVPRAGDDDVPEPS